MHNNNIAGDYSDGVCIRARSRAERAGAPLRYVAHYERADL